MRTLVLGRFLVPTVADVRRVARVQGSCETSGGCLVGLVARPGDAVAPHRRAAWLREALGEPVVVLEADTPVPPFEAALALDAGALAWTVARGLPAAMLPPDVEGPAPEAVLADPMRHWGALVPAARPHFVRRVRLVGPESTGKTTLAAALADRFETVWVPEASRDLYARKGYRFVYDDVAEVAWAQLEAEEAAAREANRVLICDTDALTTLVYARHYFGQAPRLLERLADERAYAATLLCHPDLPWQPDPVRDSPEARAHLFDAFRAELDARGIAYADVTGTGEARTEATARVVEAVLAAPVTP
jgi:HTH-type transcriptional regulator, transcriptional repressor of NAD biosynthesis genes